MTSFTVLAFFFLLVLEAYCLFVTYPDPYDQYVNYIPSYQMDSMVPGNFVNQEESKYYGRSFCFKFFQSDYTRDECMGQLVSIHMMEDLEMLQKDPKGYLKDGASCDTQRAAMLKIGCGITSVIPMENPLITVDAEKNMLTYKLKDGKCMQAKFTYDPVERKTKEEVISSKKCPVEPASFAIEIQK